MSSFYDQNLSQRFARFVARNATRVLRAMPAEFAHNIAMTGLERGWVDLLPCPRLEDYVSGLRMRVAGVGELSHPIGLAAGMDKDARAVSAFSKLGFSFYECGTVTPQPQPGNPKPRMFRQPDQLGLVNRMGFNSRGAQAVARRLKRLNWSHHSMPLGINIGKNKLTAEHNASDDYVQAFEQLVMFAKYVVINISSPNTEGLRSLASHDFLSLLAERLSGHLHKLWIKLDPDMDKRSFQNAIEAIISCGFQGVVLTNTHKVNKPEWGGQSGHPLASLACSRLEWAYEVHRGELPMIASGGILSGNDVLQRVLRGASAVQIYTALVYRGPWAVAELLTELMEEMKLLQVVTLEEVKGAYYGGEKI